MIPSPGLAALCWLAAAIAVAALHHAAKRTVQALTAHGCPDCWDEQ